MGSWCWRKASGQGNGHAAKKTAPRSRLKGRRYLLEQSRLVPQLNFLDPRPLVRLLEEWGKLLCDVPASIRLPQDADDLLRRMIRLLHDGFPFVNRKPSHVSVLEQA